MMKFKPYIILLIITLFFSACAEKKIDFTKPKIQVPRPEKVVNQKKGSLYSVQGTSLFADKKRPTNW